MPQPADRLRMVGHLPPLARTQIMANILKVSYTDAKTGESRKSAKWYGQYRDAKNKVCRTPLSENKVVAERMLRDLLTKIDRAKAGIDDRHAEFRNVPLTTHLEAYRAQLILKCHADTHAVQSVQRCAAAFEGCSFELLADLDADSLSAWLGAKRALTKTAGGFGLQTSNHYLASCKAFAAWCERTRRVPENPFKFLDKLNVAPGILHARREFTAVELAGLMDAARAGGSMRGISGPDRAMLYAVAVMTGLRAAELASLTRDSFKLDSVPPAVAVEAGYSKRRRKDTVPLHPGLVDQLRPWLTTFEAGALLWPGKWAAHCYAAKFVTGDLEAARIVWLAGAKGKAGKATRDAADDFKPKDRTGRFLDFHSLRHTFITNLVRAGVMPAVAMKLARHSTITLTIDRYTHVGEIDAAASLGKLSPPPADNRPSGKPSGR